MKLFGQLIRTAVNLAALPVEIAADAVTLLPDATGETSQDVGERTRERLEKLKAEAGESKP
jgi:hypothetical protein